ncbi:MAG: glycogen synthase [Deferribacteraceae bacterium]|jgi:starch synthase|nr:glycogen synthase [Deferribacteraceae bacterium]
MNVLFIASEMEPYAKSGGLADVVAALPKALKSLGVKVKVVIPLYSSIKYDRYSLKKIMPGACVHMGICEEWYDVHHTNVPHGVDVYFVEFQKYFNRPGYYHDSGGEYKDSAFRFSFLSRAAMQIAKDLKFKPDIVHLHDWQTAIAAYYIKKRYDPFFSGTKSFLTLHNVGYQGVYDRIALRYAMIDEWDFTPDTFEAFGHINLLKGGISFADKITTVSPTYAEEILGHVGANGLHVYINRRRNDLHGILNGVDTSIWNPETDDYIPARFNAKGYKKGKKLNKAALQKNFNLTVTPDVPIFAFIGRFAEQKGLHLLQPIIRPILNDMICQFIVLGSGDPSLERFFGELPAFSPGNAGSYIGYNENLAHLIEAGSDFFVMPSIYEPCGLNQMYSHIYGTLPVVRSIGGLNDTVEQYNEKNGDGNGFKFNDISSSALYYTIGWAVSTYYDRKTHIRKMIKNAMARDYSWEKSAEKYLSLYKM